MNDGRQIHRRNAPSAKAPDRHGFAAAAADLSLHPYETRSDMAAMLHDSMTAPPTHSLNHT